MLVSDDMYPVQLTLGRIIIFLFCVKNDFYSTRNEVDETLRYLGVTICLYFWTRNDNGAFTLCQIRNERSFKVQSVIYQVCCWEQTVKDFLVLDSVADGSVAFQTFAVHGLINGHSNIDIIVYLNILFALKLAVQAPCVLSYDVLSVSFQVLFSTHHG